MELYLHVKIISSGKTGIIVDKTDGDMPVYYVEDDERGINSGGETYFEDYAVYACNEADL